MDKLNARKIITDMHRQNPTKCTQKTLVMVAIAVMITHASPNDWILSFKQCNLHPKFKLEFAEHAKNIAGFLRAGHGYKQESTTAYKLLPPIWHGMTEQERRDVYKFVSEEHNDEWDYDMISQLKERFDVLPKDCQHIRVCCAVVRDDMEFGPDKAERIFKMADMMAADIDLTCRLQVGVTVTASGRTR